MSDKANSNSTAINFRVIPFTSGLIFFIYAWFWPEAYGHWLGTIVHSFRTTAGF